MTKQNYTLGRGNLLFGAFAAGTQTPTGERYFGNTPELNFTFETEELEHFSSEEGIREKDDQVTLEVTRTGSFTTDNISPDNIALFFFGSVATVTTTNAVVSNEPVNGVQKGMFYQLGTSSTNPSGVKGLIVHTAAVVGPPAVPAKNIIVMDGSNERVEGTDYTIDMARGLLQILPGGAIANGANLQVSYRTGALSRTRIISGSQAIEGSLRFISKNPKGKNFDYFMPWVRITPNGDYALKGEEWQTIPFNIEILKKTGLEALYVDGEPST